MMKTSLHSFDSEDCDQETSKTLETGCLELRINLADTWTAVLTAAATQRCFTGRALRQQQCPVSQGYFFREIAHTVSKSNGCGALFRIILIRERSKVKRQHLNLAISAATFRDASADSWLLEHPQNPRLQCPVENPHAFAPCT